MVDSRPALLSLEDARSQLLASIQPALKQEVVPLADALDRVAAEDVEANMPVPPWDNAAMDGYAFCRADLDHSVTLAVSQRITAGMYPQPLQPGTAARIFTGAPIPEGADTVVMQENCQRHDDLVTVIQLPELGENVRRCGNDIAADALLIAKGKRLGPFELGLLASSGIDRVAVIARPRIALLMTGDELVEPGSALLPGKIFNSNQFVIQALCQRLGVSIVSANRVSDSLDATVTALKQAAGPGNCQ